MYVFCTSTCGARSGSSGFGTIPGSGSAFTVHPAALPGCYKYGPCPNLVRHVFLSMDLSPTFVFSAAWERQRGSQFFLTRFIDLCRVIPVTSSMILVSMAVYLGSSSTVRGTTSKPPVRQFDVGYFSVVATPVRATVVSSGLPDM